MGDRVDTMKLFDSPRLKGYTVDGFRSFMTMNKWTRRGVRYSVCFWKKKRGETNQAGCETQLPGNAYTRAESNLARF